ncbi:GNAT family N-acetyltransferase [Cognataquiflexum rubidum]|uniref:GNAT family N-acetyltransferase n=1 Tax=Cognataquiflexum rubidum TaxID=2922273 RepID=UPI001F13E5B7|nr:GNAT family N-acetyltransferase [Cognataquiflexum rubidum]MCH6233307.1 GNAT family N-acetyltransferase [Cognataquiflexum rubidum]
MNPILETDRLLLRELNLGDVPFILSLLNSPGWLKYIGDRGVKNEEQAKDYLLNGPLKSYKENGFGLYLVEERISKLPIGLCGLLKRETLENPDLGFAFLSDYMGKGFAFEAANAVLEHTKSQLKLLTILAIVLPDNQRSIKLLEKLGFQYQKTFQVKEGEDLSLFQIDL